MLVSSIKEAAKYSKYHSGWSGVEYDDLFSYALDWLAKNRDETNLWFCIKYKAADLKRLKERRERLLYKSTYSMFIELTVGEYSRSVASQKRTCFENDMWLQVFEIIEKGATSSFHATELEILKFYYIDNLSQSRIAEKLNVGNGTVSRRLNRAHGKLMSQLNGGYAQ